MLIHGNLSFFHSLHHQLRLCDVDQFAKCLCIREACSRIHSDEVEKWHSAYDRPASVLLRKLHFEATGLSATTSLLELATFRDGVGLLVLVRAHTKMLACLTSCP